MVRPAAKREAVAHLRDVLQMSERRACTLVAADRKMIRYRSRRPPDAELRTRLRDLANQPPVRLPTAVHHAEGTGRAVRH